MFTRYRHITLLGVLVLAQLFLLAYQIRRPDAGGVRLLRMWSIQAVLPMARASHAVVGGVEGAFQNYVLLRHSRLEARTLRAALRKAQIENLQLQAAAAENARLNSLLAFHPRQVEQLLPAEIIGGGASLDSQVLYLDRGAADGVARNMPVLCPAGVVGKITQTFPHESEVLLITDPGSGVGAMLATSDGHGVLWGRGPGEAALRFVSRHEEVKSGERVVTSGEDQIFPAGLPLGTVTTARRGQPFWRIRVRPAAPIAQLSAVLIATRLGPQPPPPPDAAALTAAQILSQKLPSIPHEAFNPVTGPPTRVPVLLAARAAEARAQDPVAQAAAKPAAPAGTAVAPAPPKTGGGRPVIPTAMANRTAGTAVNAPARGAAASRPAVAARAKPARAPAAPAPAAGAVVKSPAGAVKAPAAATTAPAIHPRRPE